MIMEYCGGLRKEEVPVLSLKGILFFWEGTHQQKIPHIIITLKGRFKGYIRDMWHLFPIMDVTRKKIPYGISFQGT